MTVVSVLLPLALVFIMFYLGLTLQAADFRQVLRRPRALALGMALQIRRHVRAHLTEKPNERRIIAPQRELKLKRLALLKACNVG